MMAPPPPPTMGDNDPFGNHSLLDNIIHGIFGHPADELTPEDAAKKKAGDAKHSKEAVAMATSARKNPGAEFMDGPSDAGTMSLSDILSGIGKMFGGGGTL